MSELKKVDYSCLVGSQVLMEFSNADEEFFRDYKPHVGFLSGIRGSEGELLYVNHREVNGVAFDKCQIYQNPGYWISAMCLFSHSLPSGLRVKIILNDGRGCEGRTIGNIGRVISDHGTTYNIGQINCIHVLGAAEGYEL